MTRHIALIGLHLTGNSFMPPVAMGDLRMFDGMAILHAAADPRSGIPPCWAGLLGRGAGSGAWVPVPLLVAVAPAGGPLQPACWQELEYRIMAALAAAQPVDGICWLGDGALAVDRVDDPEGDFATGLRGQLKAGQPLVAGFGYQANLSPPLIAAMDAVAIARPDQSSHAFGAMLADLLMARLSAASLVMRAAHLPMVITPDSPGARQLTGDLAGMSHGPIQAAGLAGGFIYADSPVVGTTAIVVADSEARADAQLSALVERSWALRNECWPPASPVPQAVAAAKAAGLPVALLDVADDPRQGGGGNLALLLEAVIQAGGTGAWIGPLQDPPLAEEAIQRTGRRFMASFNRGGHLGFTRRQQMEAQAGPNASGVAALLVEGVIVLVAPDHRPLTADLIRALGGDPEQGRLIGIKGGLDASLATRFPPSRRIAVDLPGPTARDLSRLPFKRLPRPLWPLDGGSFDDRPPRR